MWVPVGVIVLPLSCSLWGSQSSPLIFSQLQGEKLEEKMQRPGQIFALLLAQRWEVLGISLYLRARGLRGDGLYMLEPWSLTHMYQFSSDFSDSPPRKGKSYDLGIETMKLKAIISLSFSPDSMIKTLVLPLLQLQKSSLILDVLLLVVVRVDWQ